MTGQSDSKASNWTVDDVDSVLLMDPSQFSSLSSSLFLSFPNPPSLSCTARHCGFHSLAFLLFQRYPHSDRREDSLICIGSPPFRFTCYPFFFNYILRCLSFFSLFHKFYLYRNHLALRSYPLPSSPPPPPPTPSNHHISIT